MKQTFRKTYSVSLFWNKRDLNLATKAAPISITVNLPNLQFRLSLKLAATHSDFMLAQTVGKKVSDEVKELKQILNDYITKAENILDKLQQPTKDAFKRLFLSETDLFQANRTDVLFFYHMKMDEAENEGRIGSRNFIRTGQRCLAIYSKNVCFEEIDEKWLKAYQLYLKKKGNADATIGMKLRCLRSMFNVAIKQGFIPSTCSPFKSFSILNTTKSKSVLYPKQVKVLYDYIPETTMEKRAKAYFFFCYLGNGMNFKDMTLLKFKNIKDDTFSFVREKTKQSNSGLKEIRVHLSDEMKDIINEYGNEIKNGESYLFPILKPNTDLMKQHKDRIRHKKGINKSLSAMGKKLGFEVHLCLNLARHSFATSLMLHGTPVAFISQAMGHSNSVTTEHYLKSIPSENLKSMSSQLLSFV